MIIDAVCGSVAYWNHLGPVWVTLNPSERGTLYAPNETIHAHIPVESVLGLPVNSRLHPDPHADRLTLVAAWSDLEKVKWRPCVLIEHGCGQRYPGGGKDGYDGHPSNPGGRERENVVLYLCPSSHVAQDNFMVYPDAEVAVVGPTNLDALLQETLEFRLGVPYPALAMIGETNIDFWHEFVRYIGMFRGCSGARLVRKALHAMAESWRSACDHKLSGDLKGRTLSEASFLSGAKRMLELVGDSHSDGLRDLLLHGKERGGASLRLGVRERDLDTGRTDDRPHLPQQRPVLPRGGLSSSVLPESGASRTGFSGPERSEFSINPKREESPQDTLPPGSSTFRHESAHIEWRSWRDANLPDLSSNARAGLQGETEGKPVIACSFHWNNSQHALSRWAFYDYQDVIPTLTDHFTVIGHSHPRVAKFMSRYFESHGIEYVTSLYEVASRASVYVVDNSSSGWEMAALGLPTVWLNSRRWPRHLTAWPRFYDCVPGPQVDTPDILLPTIHTALADPPPWPTIRRQVLDEVYSVLDGKASHRAVEAIRSLGA